METTAETTDRLSDAEQKGDVVTRMLVVASPSLSPLSTAGPLPTDGQPEWWRCEECARRLETIEDCASCVDAGGRHEWVPDGVFPFTVAVWQADTLLCDGTAHEGDCDRGGAIVATVEVTGPSHHAEDCRHFNGVGLRDYHCSWDALPDCWHTPTSTVTRLDPPIPAERPTVYSEEAFIASLDDHRPGDIPASWWWADLDLEVPA